MTAAPVPLRSSQMRASFGANRRNWIRERHRLGRDRAERPTPAPTVTEPKGRG